MSHGTLEEFLRFKECNDKDHILEFAVYADGEAFAVECTSCGDIIVEWEDDSPTVEERLQEISDDEEKT